MNQFVQGQKKVWEKTAEYPGKPVETVRKHYENRRSSLRRRIKSQAQPVNELIDINSKYNEYNIKFLYPILKSNVDIKVQKRKTPSTTLTEATQEESRKW